MTLRTLPLVLAAACVTADPAVDDTDTDGEPACDYTRPERPAPGELKAGVARVRVPAPVGIGTAGFFGLGGANDSPSPFAEIYPGTQRIHGHPEVKAVVLSRGEGHEAVFVRLDAIGMFAQFRREIVDEIGTRLGRDVDDVVLLGATHTHSGPARVLNTGSDDESLYDFIADKFFPEFYERYVDAVADAVEAAYDDLQPASLASVEGTCSEGHSDRRCVDGPDYENPSMPILLVERGGQVDAVIVSYAVHGTVFSLEDRYLSQDVSGAIEEAVEDRFDHPVEALMFNSWAADMAPSSGEGAPTRTSGFDEFDGFGRVRKVGWVVADAVETAVEQAAFVTDPIVELETHRVAIDRERLGYVDGEFTYPFGAVYCGLGSEEQCDPPRQRQEGLTEACLAFPEEFPAPSQVDVTVGRIGDFALTTWPGEGGTRLAEKVMADMRAAMPEAPGILFLGYAQDYLGYSILEEDWWFGGYEASGALWGPRQGEYLSAEIARIFRSYAEGTCPGDEPEALVPFPYSVDSTYVPAVATSPDAVAVEPAESLGPDGLVVVEVQGRDPWLGAPLAWIETAAGEPVLRAGGVPVDSDGYHFEVALDVDPAWDEEATERTFTWRFSAAVTPPVEGSVALAPGSYQVKVSMPQPSGEPVVLTTRSFDVVAAP